MAEKTRVQFRGYKAPPYPSAARDGCPPTSPEAAGWGATIGGAFYAMDKLEDFALRVGPMLDAAYAAGAKDARADIMERLGLDG